MPQHSSDGTIEIPEVAAEPWSPRKVWGMLKCFGPAAILASLSIGAGETIVVVQTGAWARYDLLWVVLLSCLVKGVLVTYMLGRYTAISGEHIGHRLVRMPGPRGWFLLLIVAIELLFAPLAWVAIAKPCGNLMHYLIGHDFMQPFVEAGTSAAYCENVYTILFITAALAVGLTLDYKRLEKEQLIICGILVSGTILGTILVWPNLWLATKGTLLNFGQLPSSVPKWAPPDAVNFPWLNLATVFAYVGGSVMSYIVYANWVGIRGWGLGAHPDIEQIRQRASQSPRIDYLPESPEQRERLLRLVAPMNWDILLGAVVLFIVTAAFMVSGAAVLYDKQSSFAGWRLLTDQAYIWRNIHPWLVPIYYVTIIAALWGTLSALPEVYARVTREFFSAIWPRIDWNYNRLRRYIVGLIFFGTSTLIWMNLQFDLLTQIVGFMLANLGITIAAVAAFYLNYKLPPVYRARRLVLACALASTLILILATSFSAHGLARKLAPQFFSQPAEDL